MEKDIKIGEFQKFEYPANAEKHYVSDYTVYKKKFSKVLNRKVGGDIEEFYCPKCGKKADYEQEHGDAYKCGGCGLNRQSFGNSLYLWTDDMIIIEQPEYFIRARSTQPLKKDDVVKVCGYEDDNLIVEKIIDHKILIVDSDKPDEDGFFMLRIYGSDNNEHLPVEPNSLWDYDRSLCHSTNTKALKVKEVRDNMVYFYDDMAYKGYGIEYFDGKTFKPHVKK